MDSGTTAHMVNDKNLIKNLKQISTQVGVAKASETMSGNGIGNIDFKTCRFKDVIYVPELSMNLISVNAITSQKGTVIFTEDKVIVKHQNNVVLQGMKNKNGLYEVDLQPQSSANAYLAGNQTEKAILWHRRLAHLGVNNMQRLTRLSTGMDLSSTEIKEIDKLCVTCLRSKQTRTPFTEERTRAKRPLEIIHTDLCGPIDPTTWDGKRYFMTLLDDYTSHVTIHLLKTKNEAAEIVENYIKIMEAKFAFKVAKLRCDNGREYANERLKNWCKSEGIEIDFTIPHTPQLNGRAERLNRTLVEKARALIFDAKLNKTMWGEAIYVAAYLHNRSPTKTLEVTPYEKLEGRKPDMKRIKLFGCEAYAKVLGPLKKLDERSRKYIMVGYAPTGYHLWDKKKRKIQIARDVKFQEQTETGQNQEENEEKDLKFYIKEEEETDENCEENVEEEDSDDNTINTETDIIWDEEEPQRIDEIQEALEEPISETPQRKSERTRRIPDRYTDYVLLTYNEAVTGLDKNKWNQAIEEEKTSLINNNTWKLIDSGKVPNVKPLHSRWVFRIKEDGRYKARLVIKGCEQRYGIDYLETFSPVVSTNSLRILFALAAKENYSLLTLDVKTAFLYGELDIDIYMYAPEGFQYKNKVCK